MMRLVAVFLVCSLGLNSAWADRGWHRPYTSVQMGVVIGPPVVYSPYYPYWPGVYLPPTVIVTSPPPPAVYVEQAPAPAATVPTLEPGFWYYCQEAGAYYPHVKHCPGDWRKVPPQAPGR